MFKFEPTDSFFAPDGSGHTGPCPLDGKTDATDIRKMVGEIVEIGGKKYKVMGVETFSNPSPPSLGQHIGLLVTPPLEESDS